MNSTPTKEVISVSELTQSIKAILELQYRYVHIRGEVSNLRIPYSGHIYFTLKDEAAQIRAVLFKSQQKYLQGDLQEGQSIICHGRLSVYEPRGEYQIIIDTIDHAGSGNLQLQFERLKEKLRAEGLFRSEDKKEIPEYPEKIAVITSPTGAAVYDFLKIATKRAYWGNITVVPVAVQGKHASAEIANAIELVCQNLEVDCIVLIRGGGSIEDLWAFNEEETARAIHLATIPVVTGIGHEIDFTIADMCADLHTHTPTAAAEAILPHGEYLQQAITEYRNTLITDVTENISAKEEYIRNLLRIIGDLDLYLANNSLRLDYQLSALIRGYQQRIADASSTVNTLLERLHSKAPLNTISLQEQKIQHLKKDVVSAISRIIERKKDLLAKNAVLIDSVSPLAVLSRGYAVVRKSAEQHDAFKVISDIQQVEIGENVDVKLHRGEMECQVVNKKNGR